MKNRLTRYRSGIYGEADRDFRDLNTQQYLRLLVTILISFITTSILVYPGKFFLGSYPFSYLGSTTTPLGLPNIHARIVFDLGLLLCSYTMYLMARYYQRRHPVPVSGVYAFFSYLSALGFVLMIIPCDAVELEILHSLGGAFVVGGHFIMAGIRVLALRYHLRAWLTFLLLATLVFCVIFYAILWLFGYPNQAWFQKPALAAIIYIELYGSTLSRYYGEQSVFHPSLTRGT
jgi:hypothetical protein